MTEHNPPITGPITPSADEGQPGQLPWHARPQTRRSLMRAGVLTALGAAAVRLGAVDRLFFSGEKSVANTVLDEMVEMRDRLRTSTVLPEVDLRTLVNSFVAIEQQIDRPELAKELGKKNERRLKREDIRNKALAVLINDIHEGKIELTAPVPDKDVRTLVSHFTREFDRLYEERNPQSQNML